MVLTYTTDLDPMDFRHDWWATHLRITLNAPASYREPGQASPPTITDLVASEGFEVASDHRVAIWHGGFVEAARRLHAILPWLDGTVNDLVLKGR